MGRSFRIEPGWRLLMRDLEVDASAVLRRAGLPADLFAREHPSVSAEAYARLWDAFAAEVDDPNLGLKVGQAYSVEMFDPAVFAALCSPDLNTAVARLSRYKALIGPLSLDVHVDPQHTTLTFGALELATVPHTLGAAELVFLVAFTRLATRFQVRPERVALVVVPEEAGPFEAFFECDVRLGEAYTLQFAATDARRPFLTENAPMWSVFEPELRQRLATVEADATTAVRVHAALLEGLPSGRTTVSEVATSLGVSVRTLQRRLGQEGTSFQTVLTDTRQQLARHYLASSTLRSAEISFLLGYDDPNSFFRAFHQWTGQTPEGVRSQAR